MSNTSKESNRNRWPELAVVVDQMRQVFGEIQVLNIYESGKLVAGKHYQRNLIVPTEDWLPRKKK